MKISRTSLYRNKRSCKYKVFTMIRLVVDVVVRSNKHRQPITNRSDNQHLEKRINIFKHGAMSWMLLRWLSICMPMPTLSSYTSGKPSTFFSANVRVHYLKRNFLSNSVSHYVNLWLFNDLSGPRRLGGRRHRANVE